MKIFFKRVYNFIRDTSLIFVLFLLGSAWYLSNNTNLQDDLAYSMGYVESNTLEPMDGMQMMDLPQTSERKLPTEKNEKYTLQIQNGVAYLQLEDIYFVTMDDGQPVIVLENNDSLRVSQGIQALYGFLDDNKPKYFFATRKEIFPIHKILAVTSVPVKYGVSSGTQHYVKLKGGVQFPISSPKSKELKELLGF